uniref:ABC1 atypical kinase-like domain-containing protein n=1 Tax=Setaria italica TaxID=4555 RepID=K3ZM97_SETIT
MELCTACIWTSAQWSHTLTPNRRASYHGFARSISLVPQRRRRSTLYVTNAASTSAPVSSQNITQLPRTKSISSDKPSSALEQLDIERGVCIPFRKYTPEMVRKKVMDSRGSILSLASRGVEIIWKLGFYWSSLVYDFLVGRDEEIVPRQLRNLLCDLGPSFIKAGQVLANRPDIIREDYMNELCILQDDAPPVPNQVAFAIIEEELGQPLERLFRDYRDLFLFRTLASFLNGISLQKLGCNAEFIVDEFGEKLLQELDYTLEATNIEDFLENLKDDPTVKIPRVYKQPSGSRVPVMEWIDGIRCTDPQAIKEARIDVEGFLTVGVSAALRQLLEFDLFHGDPHPGNIFAMRDGHISYVDFGNVAVLSQPTLYLIMLRQNIFLLKGFLLCCELMIALSCICTLSKETKSDVVVHAVNEGYAEMANDFTRLGFLASGTDFNQLVYNYPIRIPERFSLVAYLYVAKRLLTDPNPAMRERLIQVLFKDGAFQWKRLENLIVLAKENVSKMSSNPALKKNSSQAMRSRQLESKLDLSETIKDGARMFLIDAGIRRQLILAFTEDSKLHVEELVDVNIMYYLHFCVNLPSVARDFMLSWSDSILSGRQY